MPVELEAASEQKSLKVNLNPVILVYGFILFIFWAYTGFTSSNFSIWLLENTLTIPGLILIYYAYRWYNFSTLSLTFLFFFFLLHVYGSQHTYTQNPFGYWLQTTFDLSRNHFDRIVHFSFGLCLAYPLYELARFKLKLRTWLTYFIPVELLLSAGTVYELVEWVVATTFMKDNSTAFLGMQGDIWDAQKDIALAVVGSIITLGFTFWQNPKKPEYPS